MTNFQKTWYDEIYESDTKFPQLFIYSTGDDIIDYKGTPPENLLSPLLWRIENLQRPLRLKPRIF